MLLLFLNANARDISIVLSLCLSPLFFLSVHYEQRKKYAKYAIYIYVRFRQFLHLCISLSLCLPLSGRIVKIQLKLLHAPHSAHSPHFLDSVSLGKRL